MMQRLKTFGRLIPIIAMVCVSLAACGEPIDQVSGQAAESSPGQILFVSNHNVMRWIDGDIEQITKDVNASSPTWAPLGDRFAYIRVHEAFSELIIARRNGVQLVQVTQHDPGLEPYTEDYVGLAAWAWDPDWSPVGEELIYVSDKGLEDDFSRNLYIWIAERLDLGIPPHVSPSAASLGETQEDPNYSPDGSEVAFTVRLEEGDGARHMEIWTMNLSTGEWNALVPGTEGAYDSDWSPDGDNIAYIQRTGDRNDVWIAPLDGSEPYQLTDIGSLAEPAWSPDGQQIAFMRNIDGHFEIWVVDVEEDADGKLTAGEPRQLITADNIDAQSGISWINYMP